MHEFIEKPNGGQNFIVMKLLGKNLANQKKILGKSLTVDVAVDYLVINNYVIAYVRYK